MAEPPLIHISFRFALPWRCNVGMQDGVIVEDARTAMHEGRSAKALEQAAALRHGGDDGESRQLSPSRVANFRADRV